MLLSQNHIKQDTLYSLDCIIFLMKGLFEREHHTWKQLNVRAMPKTIFFPKKSPLRQIHIKKLANIFPISFQNSLWKIEWVHKLHLKTGKR